MTPNLTFFRILSLFFVIFITFIQKVHSESEFKKLPGKRFKTEEEIQLFLAQSDMAILAFYYKKESYKSKEVAKNLKLVYNKLQYLVEFILVDCDKSKVELCKKTEEDDIDDEFYRIEMYIPPQYKINPYTSEINTYQKLQYRKTDVSDKALYKFLTKIIISREENVSNRNFETFKGKSDLNKVLLFSNKMTSPLMIRGLSGYYYDRLAFGFVPSSEKKLCKKLNITIFPTIMVIETHKNGKALDMPNEIIYDGEMDVKHIVKFLNKYALKEKLYLKDDENEDEVTGAAMGNSSTNFFRLEAEEAMDFISKRKSKEVILYFDNKLSDWNTSYEALPEDIKEFNKETHGFFKFGYVNCTGEENEKLCKSNFNIKQFRNLVLYKSDNDLEDKISNGTILPNEIGNITREINALYKSKINLSTAKDFQLYIKESNKNNKISVIYIYEKHIGLGYNLLSQRELFKDLFNFIALENPPDEIKKHLKCNQLPYISLIIPDNSNLDENGDPQMKILVYNGKFSYAGLFSFLTGSLANDDNTIEDVDVDVDDSPVEITFIQNTDDLVKVCTLKQFCIIAFFDMKTNKESQKRFKEKFEVFKNFTEISRQKPTSFGYVNASCQVDFTIKFGVEMETLPSLIIYSYEKEVYSNHFGGFILEDMADLITNAGSGRVHFKKMLKENAVMPEIKCETIKEEKKLEKNTDL